MCFYFIAFGQGGFLAGVENGAFQPCEELHFGANSEATTDPSLWSDDKRNPSAQPISFIFWAGYLAGTLGAERKGKGCDIGYALADRSCEEAASVDACTVTALDATTAFAVPYPG